MNNETKTYFTREVKRTIAVVGLSLAVVYLYRKNVALQAEIADMSREIIRAGLY